MEKLTIGRARADNTKTKAEKRREADLLFKIGCAAVCLTLLITFWSVEHNNSYDTAIPVMSTGVETEQTDEMLKPEKDTSSNAEEWSFYDYIGQMIADLLFGEG